MGRWVKASSSNVIRFYEQSTSPTLAEGITLGDMWVDTVGTPTVKVCTSISPVTFAAVGGGGGSGAPSDATYVVLSANGTLTNEYVLAAGSSKLSLTDATFDVNEANLSIATSQLTGTGASAVLNLSGTNTGDQTDISGNAATATLASTVTTNANLTGHVTSVGNATVLGSFTIAQLSTALSDADISGTNTGDQTITLSGDATGSGTGSIVVTSTLINGSSHYGLNYIFARGIY